MSETWHTAQTRLDRPAEHGVDPPPAVCAKTTVQLGRASVLPDTLDAADTVGRTTTPQLRYEAHGSLGAGGMGEVVLARDRDIQRWVAVKRLHPDQRDAGLRRRLIAEARTVAQLDHPGIAPVYDVDVEPDGSPFFTMKRIEGDSLADVIARLAAGDAATHARFPFRERVRIAIAVAHAVAFAHDHGTLHRDLKPATPRAGARGRAKRAWPREARTRAPGRASRAWAEARGTSAEAQGVHVMVGEHGDVYVMDWGLARQADDGGSGAGPADPAMTVDGTIVGTPLYMAPEQVEGRREAIDARTDTYALCLLLFELLTLQHPIGPTDNTAALFAAIRDTEPPLATHLTHPHQPRVPAEFSFALRRGLAKDPAARYQSMPELVAGLEDALAGRFGVCCVVTATKRGLFALNEQIDRRTHLTLGLLGLLGTGLLGLAAVGAWTLLH